MLKVIIIILLSYLETEVWHTLRNFKTFNFVYSVWLDARLQFSIKICAEIVGKMNNSCMNILKLAASQKKHFRRSCPKVHYLIHTYKYIIMYYTYYMQGSSWSRSNEENPVVEWWNEKDIILSNCITRYNKKFITRLNRKLER